MDQEHHNKEVLNNNNGINQDINGEISSSNPVGSYYDAQNMRLSDEKGDKGVLKKINGEELEYGKNTTAGSYVCIGSSSVNGNLFEVFTDSAGVEDPIIRVNGLLCAKSPLLPWVVNFPLQIDKNENCKGGEVFITDFNTPPTIFNIGDLLSSIGTQKYFAEFNPNLYSVNLEAPMDLPVFVELVNIGGGGGLPVGSYQYSLRYSNDAGDKTNWGPLTPPIPVVQSSSSASSQYPYVRTFGASPDNSVSTSYAPKIRYRVTNISNYEYIEIRRISYDIEAGLEYVPGGVVVAKIPIGDGEFSVREFIDPIDSNVNLVLSDTEETNVMGYIEKAKAIRYHDKRLVLMNIKTPDRTAEPTFLNTSGDEIFPIVKALGKSGHNDPYKHTYYKNYMSGEKHTFGVNFFDGTGGKGFVVNTPSLENVQTPNRRNPMSANSQTYSYEGFAKAADTTCTNVGPVFEVFDHEDAVSKTDDCSFANIMNKGSKVADIDNYCSDGASGNASDIGYKPFTPTGQNDSNVNGHNFKINTKVDDGNIWLGYSPQCFGMNYYSRGFAFSGITDLPPWAKSFSVVKSKPADRVVCQGIGMYSMEQGDFDIIGSEGATKFLNEFWFHSVDIEKGLVPAEVIDNIKTDPDSYKLQLVSPLGFFSEVYGFNEDVDFNRDRIIDMVAYARVLHDEGNINIAELPTMGIGDGSGERHVTFNKYRTQASTEGGGIFAGDGDTLVGISDIDTITEGRGTYHKLTTVGNVYFKGNTGGVGNNDFTNNGCEDFTEPFYIVNIIQTGKEVRDLNIDSYRSTGHYQKVESIIGVGDGNINQSFILVDERWEDCIPDLSSSGPFASDESFVYLEDDLGIRRAYMCSTYLSVGAIAAIDADIVANGFWVSASGLSVYGLYSHTNSANRIFTLIFDKGYNPLTDEKIIVKYDTRLPIQVFGGDTTISENIFAPIDRESTGDSGEKDKQFVLNIGFPYRKFEVNPRRYIIKDTSGINKIQDNERCSLGYVRQLCVMYASENRIGANYSYGLTYPFQFFPQTNYIIRPNKDWKDNSFSSLDPQLIADDNNIFSQYFDDYPFEWQIWSWGGFRTRQNTNIDYNVSGPVDFFSKPDVGYKEENEFCTRIAWSLPRQINIQDSPSLKTFPTLNIFDISDKNGPIKFAWNSQVNQSGDNLYAITSSGICMLLTNKSVLANLSGADLSIMASDRFINSEYWISNEVGSPYENWRGIAEGSLKQNIKSGSITKPVLFIPSDRSTFRLLDNRLVNIAENSYLKTLTPVLESTSAGYGVKMSSVVNELNNEYWLQVGDTVYVNDYVFGSYIGKFTYDFDKYTFHKNRVFGSKDLSTFKLGEGFEINGSPIESFVVSRTSIPAQPVEKEFISLNINTGKRGTMKPTKVEFLEEDTLAVMCYLDQLQNGPLYLKQYDGWFQFIPRKLASFSSSQERVQGRMLYFKIIHNFEEEFKITNTIVQSKIIK